MLIESGERQRRRLRRACWVGFGLSLLAFVVVVGHPLSIRWRLQQHGWTFVTTARRMLPDWVPEWAAPWFGRYECARLHWAPLHVHDLELLRRLAPELRCIDLVATEMSEAALAVLPQFPELSILELQEVRLDSAGLRHLKTIPKLEVLQCIKSRVDHDAMPHVADCRGLTDLCLWDTTNDDLRCLSSLSRLRSLALIESQITDDGVKELVDGFPNLESLTVFSAPITDIGLGVLTRLRKLRSMTLDDMPITDEGIQQLGGCPALGYLLLQKTKVTASGVTELQTSHPRIKASVN
jgi:hypothetical protein